MHFIYNVLLKYREIQFSAFLVCNALVTSSDEQLTNLISSIYIYTDIQVCSVGHTKPEVNFFS